MAVYIGARDLASFGVGKHQFIVLTSNDLMIPRQVGNQTVKAMHLGGKTYGVVVGAHNKGNLVVEFFEDADHEAALEYFGGVKTKWYRSDLDAELHEVDYGNLPDSVAKDLVFSRIEAFMLNQSLDEIPYPNLGLGINSNSWAQSIIEYSNGKGVSNFKGLDVSRSKRIPRTYFESVCIPSPRPRVN